MWLCLQSSAVELSKEFLEHIFCMKIIFSKQIMFTLNVTWMAEFPVYTDWNESAVLVNDPALRFLLSLPNKKLHSGRLFNGYVARVVAFDLKLRFEAAHQRHFTSVVFVRPDVIYRPNVMIDICRYAFILVRTLCPLVMICLHRCPASWRCGILHTCRRHVCLKQFDCPQDLQEEMKQAGQGSWQGGGFLVPSMHFVLHGIPVHGTNYEFTETSDGCYQESGPSVTLAVVRDLPNPNYLNFPRLCCSKVECHEFLQTCLQDIGMDPNLLTNLDGKDCSAAPARKKNAKSRFSGSDSLTLGFAWQVQSTSHYQSLATVAQFLWWWLCLEILHVVVSKRGRFPLVGRVATNFSAGVASESNTSTFSQWSGDAKQDRSNDVGGIHPLLKRERIFPVYHALLDSQERLVKLDCFFLIFDVLTGLMLYCVLERDTIFAP